MTTHYLVSDNTDSGWEQTIYAFLAEKKRHSDPTRTIQAYSRMVFQFFGGLGKRLIRCPPLTAKRNDHSNPWG